MDINIILEMLPCDYDGEESYEPECTSTYRIQVSVEPPDVDCSTVEEDAESPEDPTTVCRHVIPVVSKSALDGRLVIGYGIHDDDGNEHGSHVAASKNRYHARIEAIAFSLERSCMADSIIILYVDDDFAEQLRCYIDYWKRNDWHKRDNTELAARASWERIYAVLPHAEVIVANVSAMTEPVLYDLREETTERANAKAEGLRSAFLQPSFTKRRNYEKYVLRRCSGDMPHCNSEHNGSGHVQGSNGSSTGDTSHTGGGRCPRCGSKLRLRRARRGPNAGGHFYGCPLYPRCYCARPA